MTLNAPALLFFGLVCMLLVILASWIISNGKVKK